MDNTKVRVENVTKVFGKHPQRALSLLKEGKSKSEILKETGMNVGVKKQRLKFTRRDFRYYGFVRQREIYASSYVKSID